ncbi:hypothetical protein [Marinimicrobium locisalis]|uniref:hypothetical protein n=1 Tax=Marinimicrobium locisalis TaxID=546022 RepID=UPI0032215FD0
MSELYILRNQEGYFLGKQKDWLDGRDRGALYKTPHKDEAVNQMVEISARDFEQRIRVLPCEADEKGLPTLAQDDMPEPRPKRKPPATEREPGEPAPNEQD